MIASMVLAMVTTSGSPNSDSTARNGTWGWALHLAPSPGSVGDHVGQEASEEGKYQGVP
jgi:hypothetical protein